MRIPGTTSPPAVRRKRGIRPLAPAQSHEPGRRAAGRIGVKRGFTVKQIPVFGLILLLLSLPLPAVAQSATPAVASGVPGSGEDNFVSRSDAIAQPRTAPEVVTELHALLQAAEIPGPYVLAGHSMGGFFARMYAATYPDEVVGLVLVDAYSEQTETLMTPEQWEAMGQLSRELGSDTVVPIPGYGGLETIGFGADNATMREAVAASPLPPMPLAVLAHGKPIISLDETRGFTTAEWEALQQASFEALAALVPRARFSVASESGHDIHQDQPELVIEAIRQVVAGVRNPDTWYDLTSCCTD